MKIIFSVIVLVAMSYTAIAAPRQLNIATGSVGWEYNKTGKKICSKLNENDRFQCKAIVTRGSLQNIELLQDGKVNLALSQSDMIPDDSVDFVSLKTVSRQALFIFVRKDADIHGIHDLMNKRINTGPIGSGLRGTMNNVLKATGIVPSQATNVTAAQEADLLCRNQTDAISFILEPDAPQVEQIEKTCLMRMLGFSRKTMEEIMRSNATYYPINVGSADREDAFAVGLYVDLITYKDALSSEDHQLIVDSLRTMP
jgi:TRAP transporter TAXI family solute receptor